jgi:hypothetical protein
MRGILKTLVPGLLIAGATLALAAYLYGYERTDYMTGWPTGRDPAHPCRDVRTLVLARDARTPEGLVWSADGCTVTMGEWREPYTGTLVTDPHELDIDHVVPLGYVEATGGASWSLKRKHAYASGLRYPRQLLAVSSSENRRKGDKGPSTYKPPNAAFWCRYAEVFGFVAAKEGLTLPIEDQLALDAMGATCR